VEVKRQSGEVNLSRPITLFNLDQDYETLQELHHLRTAKVSDLTAVNIMVLLLRERWFQYYGPHITSPGLRHAILIGIRFRGSLNLRYVERNDFHVDRASRYLQNKLDQPEKIEDADLFTACCLALHHWSRVKSEDHSHVDGILALLTCLRTRRNPKTAFSLFLPVAFDVLSLFFRDVCDGDALHFKCQEYALTFNQRDLVKERKEYILGVAHQSPSAQTFLTFYLCNKSFGAVCQASEMLRRRHRRRQLCRHSLQIFIADAWSWIDVVKYLENHGNIRILYSGIGNNSYPIEPGQTPDKVSVHFEPYYWATLTNSFMYFALILSTSVVTFPTINEAILSDRFGAGLSSLHYGLRELAHGLPFRLQTCMTLNLLFKS
jgi:hypothetical protein